MKLTFLVLIIRHEGGEKKQLVRVQCVFIRGKKFAKVSPFTPPPFFLNVRISTVSMFFSVVGRYRCDDSCENGV